MKLAPIVLKLRLTNTRFENRIGGSANLATALTYTLQKEMAFVVQLGETASGNNSDNSINQTISEKFAVIVALDNGVSDRDKTGLTAFDSLFDIRKEIFKGILGWLIPETESIVSYSGGRLVGLNRGYLWYQFEFSATSRIDDDDGVDTGSDDLPPFDTIYAQWILAPSAKFDATSKSLPVTIVDPDMTSVIDFTSNPAVDGAFGGGFGSDWFKTFKG